MNARACFAIVASIASCVMPQTGMSQGGGTLPPVVLLHGYQDGPGAWYSAAWWLSTQGFNNILSPQLNTTGQSIVDQAAGVHTSLTTLGPTFGSPMIVGHSMGGLVTRELATQWPASVLISVGSPHQGHPALDVVHTAAYWGTILSLSAGASVVTSNLFRCNQTRPDSFGNYVAGPCFTVGLFGGYVAALVGVANYVRDRYFSGPAVNQLKPNGSYINDLNSSVHVGNETANEKIAVVARLFPWEMNSTLVRAAFPELNPAQAVALSADIQTTGLLLVLDGFDIINMVDSGDPWYWEHVWGGAAVSFVGAAIASINGWWNDLIGGWPNDAFVPWWSQVFPGATPQDLVGSSHLEEPSAPDFWRYIKDAGERNRVP